MASQAWKDRKRVGRVKTVSAAVITGVAVAALADGSPGSDAYERWRQAHAIAEQHRRDLREKEMLRIEQERERRERQEYWDRLTRRGQKQND